MTQPPPSSGHAPAPSEYAPASRCADLAAAVGTAGARPDLEQARQADIRRRAIDRMMTMNGKHAEVAWRSRRRDPLEPHGIALLFIQDTGSGANTLRHRLTAATKLWLRDDHDFDVHQRVFRFYQDLAAELTGGADIREHADRRDAQMSDDAVYVGLGVSSLDTPTGAWAKVVATATVTTTDTRPARLWGRATPNGTAPPPVTRPVADHRDIPGLVRILLADGTVIAAERRGRPDFNHRIIHATQTLNFSPVDIPYPWGLVERDQLDADPAHAEVLRWMGALNELCWQAEAARLDALTARTRPRRGRP